MSLMFAQFDVLFCCLSSDHKFMEENILPLLSQWMNNNLQTKNLGSTMHVFLEKIAFLKSHESDGSAK